MQENFNETNNSTTSCEYIANHWPTSQEERDRVIRLQAWTMLPALALALPLTITYIMALGRAIYEHTVSRKLYMMLANRTFGDMITCVTATVFIAHNLIAAHPNSFWLLFLNTTFSTCFWSGLVTYTTMGLIKFYGVSRPLHYRDLITVKRCLWIIGISWFCFLFFLAITQILTLFASLQVKVLSGLTGCSLDCIVILYKIRYGFSFALTLVCILIVLVFSSITWLLVIRAKRKIALLKNNDNRTQPIAPPSRQHDYRMIRLIIGVVTFAIFQIPYAFWNLWMLVTDFYYFACHYNLLQEMNAVAKMLILFRIAFDVLLDFAADRRVRYQLLKIFPTQLTHLTTSAETSTSSGQQTRTTNISMASNGALKTPKRME